MEHITGNLTGVFLFLFVLFTIQLFIKSFSENTEKNISNKINKNLDLLSWKHSTKQGKIEALQNLSDILKSSDYNSDLDLIPIDNYSSIYQKIDELTSNLDLSNSDFSNIRLHNINLSNSDFSNSNFENARLLQCNLKSIDFGNSNLKNSILTLSDTSGCDFRYVNFRNSLLYGVNFSNTNLMGVDFTNADLSSANLSSAKMMSPDFNNEYQAVYGWESDDLIEANFKNSLYDTNTKLSKKFSPSKNKMILVKRDDDGNIIKIPINKQSRKGQLAYTIKNYQKDLAGMLAKSPNGPNINRESIEYYSLDILTPDALPAENRADFIIFTTLFAIADYIFLLHFPNYYKELKEALHTTRFEYPDHRLVSPDSIYMLKRRGIEVKDFIDAFKKTIPLFDKEFNEFLKKINIERSEVDKHIFDTDDKFIIEGTYGIYYLRAVEKKVEDFFGMSRDEAVGGARVFTRK